jgi:hypothetical protein
MKEETTSLIERWLVKRAEAASGNLAHAEANRNDWFSTMPAEISDGWREEAQKCQYAADCIATLVRDLAAARKTLRWIEDHSNDPAVVREARATLPRD